MKFEYLATELRDGGEEGFDLQDELNKVGEDGWEFAAWVEDWRYSDGPGPHSRVAILKRAVQVGEKP